VDSLLRHYQVLGRAEDSVHYPVAQVGAQAGMCGCGFVVRADSEIPGVPTEPAGRVQRQCCVGRSQREGDWWGDVLGLVLSVCWLPGSRGR
jgi:hypothetical protein